MTFTKASLAFRHKNWVQFWGGVDFEIVFKPAEAMYTPPVFGHTLRADDQHYLSSTEEITFFKLVLKLKLRFTSHQRTLQLFNHFIGEYFHFKHHQLWPSLLSRPLQ
jgi:hypothetical protein